MPGTIDQLKQIIAEKLDVNIQMSDIDLDTPLLEDGLGLDSIAIVELVTLIEENFQVHFGEEDLNMDAFMSVRALSQWIENKKATQGALT